MVGLVELAAKLGLMLLQLILLAQVVRQVVARAIPHMALLAVLLEADLGVVAGKELQVMLGQDILVKVMGLVVAEAKFMVLVIRADPELLAL
jgi:hypothetical protein